MDEGSGAAVCLTLAPDVFQSINICINTLSQVSVLLLTRITCLDRVIRPGTVAVCALTCAPTGLGTQYRAPGKRTGPLPLDFLSSLHFWYPTRWLFRRWVQSR